MDSSGRLVLIDFGLAARVDDEKMSSAPTGAHPYLSLEALAPAAADAGMRKASDQFPLGVSSRSSREGFPSIRSRMKERRTPTVQTAQRRALCEATARCPGSRRDATIPRRGRGAVEDLSVSAKDRYPSNRAACEALAGALGIGSQRRESPLGGIDSSLLASYMKGLLRTITVPASPDALYLLRRARLLRRPVLFGRCGRSR